MQWCDCKCWEIRMVTFIFMQHKHKLGKVQLFSPWHWSYIERMHTTNFSKVNLFFVFSLHKTKCIPTKKKIPIIHVDNNAQCSIALSFWPQRDIMSSFFYEAPYLVGGSYWGKATSSSCRYEKICQWCFAVGRWVGFWLALAQAVKSESWSSTIKGNEYQGSCLEN